MIYLYWYLGIGAIILALIVVIHRVTQKKDDNSLRDIMASLRPERKKLWFRLLDEVIGPALVGLLVVPFWPVIVFLKIKQLIVGEPKMPSFEEPEFVVTHEDLLTKISITDIEEREVVVDPMGAAPHVPFGHLNPAWKRFLGEVEPSDAIWTFAARWTRWGRTELRQGYVVVRGDEIGSHFMTIWKDLDEDEKPPAKGEKESKFNLLSFLRKHAD